jgi:hypothetical protein
MGLAFAAPALLALMNPTIEVGTWPMVWRDVFHLSWGLWSVVVCSLDATRTAGNPEGLPPQTAPLPRS